MNRKIAILTQPLHVNFGGTLQAYALQTKLKELGCSDIQTIDYRSKKSSDLKKVLSYIKNIIIKENVKVPFFNREDMIRKKCTLNLFINILMFLRKLILQNI